MRLWVLSAQLMPDITGACTRLLSHCTERTCEAATVCLGLYGESRELSTAFCPCAPFLEGNRRTDTPASIPFPENAH